MSEITMKDLLEAGVHFGHQTRRWNPKMRKYIFLERNGIHIMDLQKTMKCVEEARKAVHKLVRDGGKVLFVGTKKQAKETIAEEAVRCGMFHVTERWLGGTLTNFRTIRSNIQRLKEIEQMQKDGTMEKLSKKEAASNEKERVRLEKCFSGIKDMGGLPQLMFVVDTKREKIAVAEANRLSIPIVAVVDTNCDPDPIDHPIPGNDDAIRAIRLFSRLVSDTVLDARQTASEGRDVETVVETVYHAGPEAEGEFTRVP
ncbi:MAG: 30S ribosomal protein S2 [Candidatus Eisenbacteria bacterium]|nr:30S ribosomal protein S2 [Candidatus Eisenbacteria bacterium]